MKTNTIKQCHFAGMAAAVISLFAPVVHAYQPETLKWEKTANNNNVIPGTTTLFNSYNQPSHSRQVSAQIAGVQRFG